MSVSIGYWTFLASKAIQIARMRLDFWFSDARPREPLPPAPILARCLVVMLYAVHWSIVYCTGAITPD